MRNEDGPVSIAADRVAYYFSDITVDDTAQDLIG